MRHFWILLIAGALIAGACWYKLSQTHEPPRGRVIEQFCPASRFKFRLREQNPPQFRYINLRAYLGRHQILVVFYDGDKGAEADPVLVRLRNEYDNLQQRGVKVFGISKNVAADNRPPKPGIPPRPNQPEEPFPFPLLTDDQLIVHRQWGRYDAATNTPLTGAFHIDAAGNLRCDGREPLPVEDPDAVIDGLLGQ